MSLEVLSKLRTPSSGGLKYFVSCDIGGFGLNMRVSDIQDKENYVDLPNYKVNTTTDLLTTLHKVSAEIDSRFKASVCQGSVVSIAGPVENGESGMLTNWPGKMENRKLHVAQLPRRIFPLNKTHFVNDLYAHTYGIYSADIDGKLSDKFQQIWLNQSTRGPLISKSRTAVFSIGSGFGVALIIKDPILPKSYVQSTELGHLHVPSILKEEYDLIKYVSHHNYNDRSSPEFEDIVSYRGLRMLYQYHYFNQNDYKIPIDEIDANDIIESARKGNEMARKALSDHYKYMIRAAKLLAPTLQCDSVLISHENHQRNNWYFNTIQDDLLKEFRRFSRPNWMHNIRIYNQAKTFNFNILGAQYLAHFIYN